MHLSLIARRLADGLRRNMKNSLKVSKDLLYRKIINFYFIAMSLFGRDWKKVEQHIGTRSGAQIRSHAQKFFNRIEKELG
jgi:SHAQKYF class myb-like DNA-binding protein